MPLALPPGITRNGTQYQSKGRWYDANLIRFYEGTIRPWGGWRAKTTNTVTGKGRAIITWKDNSALAWCAVGTEQKLYAISRSGFVTDITPMGFATGEVDSYVCWNYRENHWTIGSLARLSAADHGALLNPLLVGNDGYVYEHETGFNYDTGVMPYLESGPVELGNGDAVMYARQLVPDDKTAGDVTVTFKTQQGRMELPGQQDRLEQLEQRGRLVRQDR